MRIFRVLRILGTFMMLGAFVMIGHSYNTAMTVPAEQGARFVSVEGKTSRPAQGTPGFIDSAKALFAGLIGKEQEPQSDLSALHTRTRVSSLSYDERSMREMNFWMDFTSKLGFTGP